MNDRLTFTQLVEKANGGPLMPADWKELSHMDAKDRHKHGATDQIVTMFVQMALNALDS